nr:alpha-glucosidase [Microbacterium pseudoresistens]
MDSDGDGIGDLGGILARLDHLQDLGVDALWLSPVYDSPNDDNGYDIRDYRAVMAEFGTMDDLDRLVHELHRRGMRLIMDLVVNHTSDEHAWFQQALADPASPYRDYYFFRPGEPDAPPNNWTSFFSGSAWRWFPERGEWALHLFSPRQMDLDWTHPPMREEIVEMVRWWLEKGVDGFRLDVINYISKPPALPDGDATVGALMEYTGVEHYFAGPRLHEHLRQLRAEAFEPYAAVSIGETPGVGARLGRLLTAPDRGELDMIFGFDHLDAPGRTRFEDYRYDLRHLRDAWTDWQREYGATCWPSLFLENHDNPRMISKIDPRPEHRAALGTLLLLLKLTLRGTPFLYQGQELGLVNHAFSSVAQLRDVESLNRYAALRELGRSDAEAFAEVLAGSRDHARVPMPWTSGPYGGFTDGTPWLMGDGDHEKWNAKDQAADPGSVLRACRDLIALRRAHPALTRGAIVFGPRRRGLWLYERRAEDETIGVAANLTDRPHRWRMPARARLLYATGAGDERRLVPYEARVYALEG